MKAKPRGTSRAPRTKPKAPKCQPRSAREDRMDYLAQQRLSKEAMSCQQFIWCCKSAILDQLARGEPPGGEQVFLQILLNEVVAAVRDTVAAGDVNTAQFLGNIQYVLSQARGVYGPKIEVPRVLSVARESLLREHSPREWIEVFDARQRVADLASLDGVRTARNYRLAPEHFDIGKLRKLTDAELEKWFFTAGVGIAKALVVSRGRESAEINKFIVLLQQGWFANGGPWQPCPWKGRAQLPALAEVKAFLREATQDEPRQLRCFQTVLAHRKNKYRGKGGEKECRAESRDELYRLAEDKRAFPWNAIDGELDRRWPRWARRHTALSKKVR